MLASLTVMPTVLAAIQSKYLSVHVVPYIHCYCHTDLVGLKLLAVILNL